jgi:uncharacterized membrane protein (DUF4010 family)
MSAFEWTFELRFVVALALGALVGLERESTKVDHQGLVFAGVRTFPIISMFGFGCAWLYQAGATFVLPAGLLSISVLTALAYVAKVRAGRFGVTTEVSALVIFIAGALALLADVWVAMALGVINTILLSEKAELESYVERLNRVEFLATLKFLLVTVIILPVLPNQEYTRFRLNPTRIWEIVILVSTVGFVGYFLSKKFGNKAGLWLSGILGGIVSSTAVTIASGRIARKYPERSGSALQSAILAGSVMYIRILILIWALNQTHIPALWWRLVLLAAIGVMLSVRLMRDDKVFDEAAVPGLQNPFEVRPALAFALLFTVLSVVTEFVRTQIGDAGLLILSAVVGVSDIDPFVLSLVHGSQAGSSLVVSAIIMAMLSNTVAKGAYFIFLAPPMRKEAAWRYGLWALLHVPLIMV